MPNKNVLCLGILGLLFLVPAAARAQNCDATVVDEAGALGSGAARVEAAAQELTAAGAEVRVRVIRTFGSAGSLDRYEAAMERSCLSWQAVDGGTKNNLVALFVAVGDRKTGLYYGSLWKRSLDTRWTAIQTDEMNPRFRDGDFAGGIAAGLKEITQVVTARAHTYTPPAEAPVPTTVVNTKPADLTGLWIVLGSVVGLAAMVLLVVFAVRLKRARARRRAAQQKARQLKNACSAKVLELSEALPILEAKIRSVAAKVSDEDAAPLLERHAALARDLDGGISGFADLQNSAGDPDRDGKSYEEYAQMQTAYQEVLDRLEKIRSCAGMLEADLEELKQNVDKAPAAVAKTTADIEAAADAVAAIEARGFRTAESQATLEGCRQKLAQARKLLDQRRFTMTIAECGKASTEAGVAANLAESLPRTKAELDAAVGKLKERIGGVAAKIDDGRQVFEAIASDYAESCWSVVSGNGTEAEKREAAAKEAVAEAVRLADMKVQEWADCSDVLAQANAGLDEAESFMRSIVELKKNLDEAKASAPADIETAAKDIATARTFIRAHADDINDPLEDRMKSDLDEAEQAVDQARSLLHETKPDYLVVVKTARQAEKAADAILAKAQGEFEAAERLRRRAASAIQDAARSISAAKEYIEDHSSDVDSDAESKLNQARSCLTAARAATTCEEQIRQGEQADKLADSALAMARRDVSNAEAARAAERRRREAAARAAAAALSSRISSSRRSSGFGGSSGWGSSSRGGGSSGFGGSSRGGGSTGW